MTAGTAGEDSVSVVIPTKNGGPLLMATLDSVFAQTRPPLEIIVVDDGSTDDTVAQLAPLAASGRVRLISQPTAGTAHARNTGVAAATGTLIALLDHDDLWPPETLAGQVEALAARPDAVLAYGDMESFGMERPYRWPGPTGPAGDVLGAFRRKNWIRSPGQAVIRAAAIRAVGGFDAALAGADDWDLYLKLAGRGPFVYTGRLALRYRVHAGNQSKQAWRLFRRACLVQARHAGRWPQPGQRLQWLACRATLVHMLVRDLLARQR